MQIWGPSQLGHTVIRKARSVDKKHPREVVKNRNSIPNVSQYITSKNCQHPVKDNQCPRRAGHHSPSLLPISGHMITCYFRYQGSKYTVIYIYTLVQTIISIQTKLGIVRRKHTVHPTGFGAYSSTCCKGSDNRPAPWESISSHPHGRTVDTRHAAALTFHDEFVQKYIGSRWNIGIRDITFSDFIIVTVKCFPTIYWGCVMTTVYRVSMMV